MDKKEFEIQAKSILKRSKEEIAQLKELTKPIAPENAIGRISRMDAINNKSVNEASLRQMEEKVREIENALTRLDEKDFGMCKRCHKPIPEGRLLLLPGTTTCVNCA